MKKTIVLIGAAAFIAAIAMMLPGCSDNAQTTEAPPVTDSTNTTSGTSPETVTDTSSGETDSEPSEDKYNIPVKNYTLIYEDEFDGAVNTSDWRFRTDEKGGGKNLAINVTTSDGKLNIAFAKQGSTYTGGGIISKELFGYGYYETKCTLFAEGGGLHSAFWLMGGSSSDGTTLPKQNTVFEIDGFEFDSNKPDTISFNLNYKLPRVYGLINAYKVESLSGREAVVGFEWLPDRINWYLDGKLMHTVTQDEELLGHVQSAILQVQGDCEKLNITTSNLIEDHRQKQKDIDVRAGGGRGWGTTWFPAPYSLLPRPPRCCTRVWRSWRRRRPTGNTWRWKLTW